MNAPRQGQPNPLGLHRAAALTHELDPDVVLTLLNSLVRVDGCRVTRRRAQLPGLDELVASRVLVAIGDEVEISHDRVLDALTRRPVGRTAQRHS